jgi:hypothetical protein
LLRAAEQKKSSSAVKNATTKRTKKSGCKKHRKACVKGSKISKNLPTSLAAIPLSAQSGGGHHQNQPQHQYHKRVICGIGIPTGFFRKYPPDRQVVDPESGSRLVQNHYHKQHQQHQQQHYGATDIRYVPAKHNTSKFFQNVENFKIKKFE